MSDAETWRRIPIEVFNEGKVELIDEYFSQDFVEHSAPPPLPPTLDALKQFVPMLRAAFPDFKYEILGQMQDGDMHFGYLRASGTMGGDFMGMPASGKSATWDEMHYGRFADGKVAEHWAVFDRFGMLEQLGFIPPQGGPPA